MPSFYWPFLLFLPKTNSFEFSALGRLPEGLKSWVFLFLLIAAWAKAAQVPFQTWLPDAMEAPTPISAYLHAAAMVKAGVYLMARTVSSGWGIPTEDGIAHGRHGAGYDSRRSLLLFRSG